MIYEALYKQSTPRVVPLFHVKGSNLLPAAREDENNSRPQR